VEKTKGFETSNTKKNLWEIKQIKMEKFNAQAFPKIPFFGFSNPNQKHKR